MVEIEPWNVAENSHPLIKFKITDKFLTVLYQTKNDREALLRLGYNLIPKLLEKEPQTKQISDMCDACNRGTSNYIWIKQTDNNGNTYKEKFAIHPHCYKNYKKSIKYIQQNYSDELTAETI